MTEWMTAILTFAQESHTVILAFAREWGVLFVLILIFGKLLDIGRLLMLICEDLRLLASDKRRDIAERDRRVAESMTGDQVFSEDYR